MNEGGVLECLTCSIVGSEFFCSSIGLPTTIYNGFLNGIGDLKRRVMNEK